MPTNATAILRKALGELETERKKLDRQIVRFSRSWEGMGGGKLDVFLPGGGPGSGSR